MTIDSRIEKAGSLQGKYIRFDEFSDGTARKTKMFLVTTTYDNGTPLGEIRFFPRWRKFSFFPLKDTLYESTCLRDIAAFCDIQTAKWRGGLKR